MFDSSLHFESHINQLAKSYFFFHHRNIVHLRPSFSFKDAETVVHAFITSCLNYCNSLFYGLPNKFLNRLQLIQNSAARVLTFTKTSAHITLVLQQLHWLPVTYRIQFKNLVLVFKAMVWRLLTSLN